MSTKYNDVWLENLREMFEQELEEGHWGLCEAIILDAKENGFPVEAEQLRKRYQHVKYAER